MVKKGDYPNIPKHFSKELSEMIDLCLTNDPDKRPTASEILDKYPFNDPSGTPQSIKKQKAEKVRSNSHMDKKSCLTESGMYKVIKLPAKLEKLNEGMLPSKNYSDSTKNADSKKISYDHRFMKSRPQNRSQEAPQYNNEQG